jgi:phosphate transport system protein
MEETVQELHQDVVHMGDLTKEAVARASRGILEADRHLCEEVIGQDDVIDRMELAIARKCIEFLVSGESTAAAPKRKLAAILRVITDLERIADLAVDIALIGREIALPCPAKITRRLQKMVDLTSDMVERSLCAFVSGELHDLHRLREQESTVEIAHRWLHAEVLRHLEAAPDYLRSGVWLLFASHALKRMAAHATNIGEWAIFSVTSELGRLKSYHPTPFPATLLSLG